MLQHVLRPFVQLTGNDTVSSVLQRFTRSPYSKCLVRPFHKAYALNEREMTRPLDSFESLHDLFTRSIRQELRPIDDAPTSFVSPADSVATSFGTLDTTDSFTIKGHTYSLTDLFGDEAHAAPYHEGSFAIFYLSPQHYHHFHYPVDGTIVNRYALGNVSYPVNSLGLTYGDAPFKTNYRIITELQTTYGRVAVVKVGALNVNTIDLYPSNGVATKGDDFGFFSFGSTVVVLIDSTTPFHWTLSPDEDVRVGERVGQWDV